MTQIKEASQSTTVCSPAPFEDFATFVRRVVPPSQSWDPHYCARIDQAYAEWERERLQPEIEKRKQMEDEAVRDMESTRKLLNSLLVTLVLTCFLVGACLIVRWLWEWVLHVIRAGWVVWQLWWGVA
jgi:hypothetical protein